MNSSYLNPSNSKEIRIGTNYQATIPEFQIRQIKEKPEKIILGKSKSRRKDQTICKPVTEELQLNNDSSA